MKDEQIKNIWNMIKDKEDTEMPSMTTEQFIKGRSGSIQDKIRGMLQNDLILKAVSGIALFLNLLFYKDTPDVLYICLAGILFLILMTTIEWKTFKGFKEISSPTLATKEVLSNIMIYLKRKSNLYELTIASSQILIFVPGLLVYFFMVYGQVKPMTGLSFFVFTTLALIGTIMSFARVRAQIKYHIKYLSICLSDLNENTLKFAVQAVEDQRKQDGLLKFIVYFLLILGFIVFIAVLKSLTG